MTANQLSEEQITEMKKAFDLLDKDGDGSITRKELCMALYSAGEKPSGEYIDQIICEGDTDGNGAIEFTEFLNLMANRINNTYDDDLVKAAFNVIDQSKSGSFNAAELMHIMQSLGEEITEDEIEEMIKDADTDGTGCVSYEEFLHLMKTI